MLRMSEKPNCSLDPDGFRTRTVSWTTESGANQDPTTVSDFCHNQKLSVISNQLRGLFLLLPVSICNTKLLLLFYDLAPNYGPFLWDSWSGRNHMDPSGLHRPADPVLPEPEPGEGAFTFSVSQLWNLNLRQSEPAGSCKSELDHLLFSGSFRYRYRSTRTPVINGSVLSVLFA